MPGSLLLGRDSMFWDAFQFTLYIYIFFFVKPDLSPDFFADFLNLYKDFRKACILTEQHSEKLWYNSYPSGNWLLCESQRITSASFWSRPILCILNLIKIEKLLVKETQKITVHCNLT